MLNRGLHGKDRGMVIVIVIAAIMVLSVFALGTVSRFLSKATSAESQASHIEAEMLAKGAFWRAYQNGGLPPAGFSETLSSTTGGVTGNKTYTVTFTNTLSAGPFGASKIDTTVTY